MTALNRFEFSGKDFATLCQVTQQSLKLWEAEGMPAPEKPTRNSSWYDLRVHLPWVIEHKFRPSQTTKARKLEAETAIQEMKRDEQAGLLVQVSIVQREYEDFLTRLRSNLLGFGDRLVPLIGETEDPRERLTIARREMAQTLRDLEALLD